MAWLALDILDLDIDLDTIPAVFAQIGVPASIKYIYHAKIVTSFHRTESSENCNNKIHFLTKLLSPFLRYFSILSPLVYVWYGIISLLGYV